MCRTRPSYIRGKHDPLFRVRKLLLKAGEQLDHRGREKMLEGLRVGDPYDEVLGGWIAKEAARAIYAEEDPEAAAVLQQDDEYTTTSPYC